MVTSALPHEAGILTLLRARNGRPSAVTPGDSCGDLFGQQLSDPWILKGGVLLGIGDESEFQKGCGALVVMQHIVAGELHPAAVGSVAGGDLAQDVGSQRCGAGIIIIGLDPVGGPPRRGVEMDAHEGGVRVRIGDPGSSPQRDEDIGRPGHHDTVASGLQQRLHPAGHVEGQHLLGQAFDRLGTVVVATVAGIDDHRAEIGKPGTLLEEGAARQEHRSQKRQQTGNLDHEGALGHDKKGI